MEAEDQEVSRVSQFGCTCGHSQQVIPTMADDNSVAPGPGQHFSLDASFVHLTRPPPREASSDSNHEGLLETLRQSSQLLRVAQGKSTSQHSSDPGVSLCQDCIDRVARALESDTDRLKMESLAYERAVVAEEESRRMLRKAVENNIDDTPDSSDDDILVRAASAFRDEIKILTTACEQHENELHYLQSLQKQQMVLSQQLELKEDGIWEERNALELEAKALDNIISQLGTHCLRAQKDLESLSMVKLHPALFDLVVDKRGLRYPLINELRLAFRPKGDVKWKEINAAWSQAAQLLLFVGASVDFRSRQWRIVPLTPVAKLMFISPDGKRAVYSLGSGQDTNSPDNSRTKRAPEMSMSLRALNCLLDEMVRHVLSLVEHSPKLPYEISRHRVGTYDLSRLNESDDSSWSQVIHRVASNLQWLSDRASEYTLEATVI
mmetsp:Transcript_21204/g.32617  ORF Transcript_21204/g.32617 Transcript_21204/m.32617 type:complete len:436 (+) Transcript_21204:59-1366(+)